MREGGRSRRARVTDGTLFFYYYFSPGIYTRKMKAFRGGSGESIPQLFFVLTCYL